MANHLYDRVIRRPNGCWEWTGSVDKKTGYGYAWFGRDIARLVHRRSYELAKGPIGPKLCVCHTCDNRLCVNPEHLWLGTREENNHDRDAKGRTNRPVGESHPRAKLNRQKVAEIRSLAGLVSRAELASRYGVGVGTIRDAQVGRNWA